MKDSEYISAKIRNEVSSQLTLKGLYFEIFMGELYLCKSGGRNIGIRTIGELKAAYFKLTNETLIIHRSTGT